jgi:hypothetical protein
MSTTEVDASVIWRKNASLRSRTIYDKFIEKKIVKNCEGRIA